MKYDRTIQKDSGRYKGGGCTELLEELNQLLQAILEIVHLKMYILLLQISMTYIQ
jgi:hypothetical protein